MALRRSQVLLLVEAVVLCVMLLRLRGQLHCRYRLANPRGVGEVEELFGELRSPNACLRSVAALNLQKTGLSGADAAGLLPGLLSDPNDFVRWRAAAALGDIGVATPHAILSLISALQDDNVKVRFNATYSLGKLSAPEAGRPLAALATDPDPGVRHNALYTLRFIALANDREWLCPVLKRALQSGADGWLAAAETAGVIGCIGLIPDITSVRAEWESRCPSTPSPTPSTTDSNSSPHGETWALTLDIGKGCESGTTTHAILDKTLRMLTARKGLESL